MQMPDRYEGAWKIWEIYENQQRDIRKFKQTNNTHITDTDTDRATK